MSADAGEAGATSVLWQRLPTLPVGARERPRVLEGQVPPADHAGLERSER